MIFKLRTIENGGKTVRTGSLGDIIPRASDGPEKWLLIAPHDDDILIGGGLLLQEAVLHGRRIKLLITTDGSQGYCFPGDRDRIAEVRRRETLEAYGLLGIPESDIQWLDFPDGGLALWQGRRAAGPGRADGAVTPESPAAAVADGAVGADGAVERARVSGTDEAVEPSRAASAAAPASPKYPEAIAGFTGLENSFTYHLRAFRPSHVFLMSESDYHPDHKIVYREALISIFHALGDIWPELGPPLVQVPRLYEMAAYCNFSTPPTIEIEASREQLQRKLDAIAVYRSQKQIGGLVDNLEKNGPYEYLLYRPFDLFSPQEYRAMFSGDAAEDRDGIADGI